MRSSAGTAPKAKEVRVHERLSQEFDMASLKDRLIEVLIGRKLLTREQLEEALSEQRDQGGNLQDILTRKGLVGEADLLSALSQGLGIPPINITRMRLDPSLKRLIPRNIAMQYEVIPVSCIGQTLTVAMADPLNVFALDTINTLTGLTVNPVLTRRADIKEALGNYYGSGVEETVEEITRQAKAQELELVKESQESEAEASELLSMTEQAPVVRYTEALLEQAVHLRASDLLVEPMEKRLRIRYRVDGVLQEGQAPPKHLHSGIISRIKVLSELNIAERRLPQDGHFRIRLDNRPVDFRVSILPAQFGEKLALRVLDKGVVKLDINKLGFGQRDLECIKASARRPHGLMLATGPTGSGKTTTLYSLLRLIDEPSRNLVTVEDPVEFDLHGINQVSTRPEVGLTFASSLRSILRQDPDVIMVGEIRDSETADMAVKSALTGHLVISTLHTNTAAGTIIRLINMGVEPFLINSCLMLVVGQRLVRRICRYCKEAYKPPLEIAKKLGLLDEKGEPLVLAKGRGCDRCMKSGYTGREVIAEVLQFTPEVRELVLKRTQEREIEAVACKQGMRRLRYQGLEKVKAHVTTLEEVFRTTTGEAGR